jgi:hypothetical protein
MKRTLLLTVLGFGVVAGTAVSQDAKSLTRLMVPDDPAAASKAVKEWLEARGFDCDLGLKGNLIFTKDGVLHNIAPIVGPKQLDRLVVSTLYNPKDEYKGSKDLTDLAAELNASENFLRVYIDKEGHFVASASLTFYDELTAHEFDAFMELFDGVLKQYILTPEALKILK